MNYRIIINVIGKILCVEAVFMLPALLIALFRGETAAVWAFAITIVLLLAAGLPCGSSKPKKKDSWAKTFSARA